MFPGSDPAADWDPAAYASMLLTRLTPAQIRACGAMDAEFAEVAAATRARMIGADFDAIREASRPSS